MHTFRLLSMAEEIGKEGTINVRRDDREYLLSIKWGDFAYEVLVQQAEEKIAEIAQVYKNSVLPNKPDLVRLNSCWWG